MQTAFDIRAKKYFNVGGPSGTGGVPTDPISAIADAVGSIFNLGSTAINKTGLQGDVKAACGAKPAFNLNGSKDAYNQCAANFVKSQMQVQANNTSTQLALAQLQAQIVHDQTLAANSKIGPLGIAGIITGSVLILGLTAFLLLK